MSRAGADASAALRHVRWTTAGLAERAMDVEFHQLELAYAALRIRGAGRRAHLMAALAEQGQHSPVLVVSRSTVPPVRYVLIDGYLRVEALKQLGRDTASALVLPLSEADALCLCHRQETTRRRSALEDGWLIRELVERHGLGVRQVGRELGRTASWVSRRLALVQTLPQAAQAMVLGGQLCAHGAGRYLVPLARANSGYCERLLENLGRATLSTRELERLYVAWRAGAPSERERLVAEPLLYLKAEQAARAPPPDLAGSEEQKLRHDLEVLGAVARRAAGRMGRGGRLRGALPLSFDGVWQTTWEAVRELTHRMEERLHAGLGYAHGDLRAQSEGARDQAHRPCPGGVEEHGQEGPG